MGEKVKLLAILTGLALVLTLARWSEWSRARSMEAQAQEVARCRSLNGVYASGKCYINGEEE